MIKRLFLLLIVVICIGGAAAYYLVPWNEVLQNRITAFLDQRGMKDIKFQIDKVGIYQATLNNVAIGKENPLLLQSIIIRYDPKEILDGNLKDLTLSGLDIGIRETDDGWKIDGFGNLPSSPEGEKANLTLSDIVDLLPFSVVSITDSHLRVNGKTIQATLPFAMNLTKSPEPSLDIKIDSSHITAGDKDISVGPIAMKATQDATKNWNGNWTLASFDPGDAIPIPPMSGTGTLSYMGTTIAGDGSFQNTDKSYNAAFKILYDLNAAEKSLLTVTSLSLPFKEGRVSASNVAVPLQGNKPVTINMQIKKVSIDSLLQTLTGKRVSATGTVSGTIPVIVKRDGSYALGKGSLKADTEGLIQMPGDVIPGDNEQVDLVRQILENLHYQAFSAAVETNGGKAMTVRLSLEGNNPDVYNGRAVKLNVNLTGDLLDFIQQNAMLITNPEKLLEQGAQ